MLGNVWAELIKEWNFAHMLEVIYQTERFFARKIRSHFSFQTNCRLKIRIVVNNRLRELSCLFVENLLPSRIRYFFIEKPRKVANFSKICLHYFCTILYPHLLITTRTWAVAHRQKTPNIFELIQLTPPKMDTIKTITYSDVGAPVY